MSNAFPRGLVCEDQALIAFELVTCLQDAGVTVAGCFPSGADALAWADSHTPDFAILDFKLNDGACTALIRLLRARGVPVIIYSGWPQHACDTPSDLRDLPWLSKPLEVDALLEALGGSLPEGVRLRVHAFGEALPMGCDDAREGPWGAEVNRRVEVWVSG